MAYSLSSDAAGWRLSDAPCTTLGGYQEGLVKSFYMSTEKTIRGFGGGKRSMHLAFIRVLRSWWEILIQCWEIEVRAIGCRIEPR